MAVDYGSLLISQLSFYWDVHLWPRLEGLTDEEYFWEPAVGCWSLRQDGDGGWMMDRQGPREPDPPPLTTLAWCIVHVATAMSTRTSTLTPCRPEHFMEHDERPALGAVPVSTDPAAPPPNPGAERAQVAETRTHQVRLGRGRRSKIR
jgi:hypothetical protein